VSLANSIQIPSGWNVIVENSPTDNGQKSEEKSSNNLHDEFKDLFLENDEDFGTWAISDDVGSSRDQEKGVSVMVNCVNYPRQGYLPRDGVPYLLDVVSRYSTVDIQKPRTTVCSLVF
jgi:hypothetical protein